MTGPDRVLPTAEGAELGYAAGGATQEELDDIARRILREFPPGAHR